MDGVVYGLFDPRDGELRYVGRTKNDAMERLQEHISHHTDDYRGHWIDSLKRLSLRPFMVELERVRLEDVVQLERTWIACMRSLGARLVNSSCEAEGITEHTAATREKIRLAKTGKPRDEATKEAIRLALKGRPGRKHTQAECEKMAQPRLKKVKGHRHSPETIAKLKLARANQKTPGGMTGRKHSEETKEKMRQATLRKAAERKA